MMYLDAKPSSGFVSRRKSAKFELSLSHFTTLFLNNWCEASTSSSEFDHFIEYCGIV